MLDANEFLTMSSADSANLIKNLTEIPDSAPPVLVEEVLYNAAGVVANKLKENFDLKRITKRDVALYFTSKGVPLDKVDEHVHPVAKYIRSYFSRIYQGPLDEYKY